MQADSVYNFDIINIFFNQLDVDPQRDDDASPMSTCRCMLRPT